jgi:hypothetical protein
MFHQARLVEFTKIGEGTTPKIYPLSRIVADFSEGPPKYQLELGPPIPEIGSPMPKDYGQKNTPYRLILEPVKVSENTRVELSGKGYLVDASGGDVEITLPAAKQNPALVTAVTKVDSSANTVTVVVEDDEEKIANADEQVLTTQNESGIYYSDGTDYQQAAGTGGGMKPRHDIETLPKQIVWTDALDRELVRHWAYRWAGGASVVEDMTQADTSFLRYREWFFTGRDAGYMALLPDGIFLYDALNFDTAAPFTSNEAADGLFAYLMDATSGNLTLTLPSLTGLSGRVYSIAKVDDSANTVTITPTSPDTIDGDATKVLTERGGVIIIGISGQWHTLSSGSGGGGTAGVFGISFRINERAVEAGLVDRIVVPDDGTITGWQMGAESSGSVALAVKRATYSAFPTFSTIHGSTPPSMTSAQKAESTTLTGWSTALSGGDFLEISVTSASGVGEWLTFTLFVTRS